MIENTMTFLVGAIVNERFCTRLNRITFLQRYTDEHLNFALKQRGNIIIWLEVVDYIAASSAVYPGMQKWKHY